MLARQSVVIKSKNTTAILLGNYEIAYAIGVMYNLSGQQLPEYQNMEELRLKAVEMLSTYQPQNEKETNIIRMLSDCKGLPNTDDQVMELLEMGMRESRFWTI